VRMAAAVEGKRLSVSLGVMGATRFVCFRRKARGWN
jgi:hypothetical protein